eukprot:COSAG02_NODE_21_length_53083_cov_95.733618_46_plen_57_part_00
MSSPLVHNQYTVSHISRPMRVGVVVGVVGFSAQVVYLFLYCVSSTSLSPVATLHCY